MMNKRSIKIHAAKRHANTQGQKHKHMRHDGGISCLSCVGGADASKHHQGESPLFTTGRKECDKHRVVKIKEIGGERDQS